MNILVTGGAGFIGSHLVDALVSKGHIVTIIDKVRASYVNSRARFVLGDIKNREIIAPLIEDADAIFHYASTVGINQSMYKIADYNDNNVLGTAILLDILANEKHNVKKIIFASSSSIYGEGAYNCSKCGTIFPDVRSNEQLARNEWELKCSCGNELMPIATNETKPLMPNNIYAITKRTQEELCLTVGKNYNIQTIALRYPYVIGPRQALDNPYTGVTAIFTVLAMNNRQPLLYEDGLESRDFVHVKDVVNANLLALESNAIGAINIGSGKLIFVKEFAETIIELCGKNIAPKITKKYRPGDVRHCYLDVTKAKQLLNYTPKFSLKDALKDYIEWAMKQTNVKNEFEEKLKELEAKGLFK